MEKSLFRDKETPESRPPDPYDLIDKEIGHLKKGSNVRHGPNAKNRTPNLLLILGFCGIAWLYLMDPFYHAWYKGDAVKAYLYLRNFGSASDVTNLVASGILNPEDLDNLNHRSGSYQDYYSSPDAAKKNAEAVINYMTSVKLLHAGKYQQLDPVGRMRYAVFLKFGIILPTDWPFLDPTVNP